MPIDPLPSAPLPTDNQATFNTKAFNLVAALGTFVTQTNAVETAVDADAATASAAATTASNAAATALAAGTSITGTSTSTLTIGTGSKSLTIETGRAFVAGMLIRVGETGANANVNYMQGAVTSYNAGTGALVFNATVTGGTGTLSTWAVRAFEPEPITANLQVFSSSGTWTKPANAQFVMVELWGAGGGGGSGRRGDAPSAGIRGGGGGGGGAYGFRLFRASDLASTEAVTIGAGGTGGAATTVNNTNGNSGASGGNSSFGALLTMYGGAGGNRGGVAGDGGGGGTGGGVLSIGAPSATGAGHFGAGSGDSQASGFGGGNGGGPGGSGGGSSFQGGPGGGNGGAYENSSSTPSGNGGGITGSSGTGAIGEFIYAGTNGIAGSGRQGGSGGAAGYSQNNATSNAAFGNGTFAVVTQAGHILTSSNGTNNWVFAQSPSGLRIERILHDGTQFVLMGFSGTRCWTTTNFSTFTERTAPGSSVSNLRFANSRYFAATNAGLLQSTDLVTWSTVTTGMSGVIDICWSGTNYVVSGASSPFIRYSPDLTTWTTPTGIGTSAAYYCTSNGSGTVVVSQTGTGGFNATRSTNHGVTFSNVSTTLPTGSGRLSFANSTYFYTDNNELWTSSDGTSWTQRSTNQFGPTGYIAFDGTTFVIADLVAGADPVRTSTPAGLGTWTARAATARDVAGGTGGAGGSFGSGGGGGGGANNGQNSGAGGTGGAGSARIYSW
jgi:hypothetical protein